MKPPSSSVGFQANPSEGMKKGINSELWHACAGPLVSLPPVGSLVVYFPQGHSEQVAASMQKDADCIPGYPSLPSKLICVLHNVTLHADAETDEVYAQMTLQPVNKYDNEALMASEMGLKQNKHPVEFFCKTLTASDTSTHGGFSVPRRAAEKIFPPLDFAMQPPAQELVAKDLHDASWTFRHVFRGQPKRHLLTTGWSVFISTKGLQAGDSVLFIRDEKSHLLLGTRHSNRQQSALSSSVLSSDSMHIGILAAAAHAASNNSPFTIFYNPRTSPSEFVIPLAKYNKAMYSQASLGMRFRMMFETEESGVRRYMGTVTGISDSDPVRWKNSQWRNLQVGWDESTAIERRTRVSIWEIEPVATPFYICPPPFFRPKFSRQPGMPGDESDAESAFKRVMPWLGDDFGVKDVQNSLFPGVSLAQWMSMQQNPMLMASAAQSYYPSIAASATQNNLGLDDTSRLLNFQSNTLPLPNSQIHHKPNPTQQLESYQQQHSTAPQQHQQQQLQKQNSIHLQQHQQPPLQQQISAYQQQQEQQQQPQQPSLLSPPPSQQGSAHLLQQQSQQLQRQQQDQLLQQQKLQQHQLRPVVNQEIIDQHQQKQQAFGIQSITQNQSLNQLVQPPLHHIRQGLQKSDNQLNQSSSLSSPRSFGPSSLSPVLQFQQPAAQQQALLQMQQNQLQQAPLSQSQLQLQLLQKLQEQQVFSQLYPNVQSDLQQQLIQQNQQLQQKQYLLQQQQQQQQQQVSGTDFSTAQLRQLQQTSTNHQNPQLLVRSRSTPAENNAPSCSTSPSTNSIVSPSRSLNRSQQRASGLADELFNPPVGNLLQELESKPDVGVRNELNGVKEMDRLTDQHGITDQLDASSATSFSLDGNAQEGFSMPSFGLDGDIQVDPRNNFLIRANSDNLIPNTQLSRGSSSGKDMQDLFSAYGNQRDVETEVSTAAISSQSFGVPYASFKPGCSSDVVTNENGIVNRGTWGNQPQRMRTYTKVQKRGSVGRTIDVARYRGYDDLRHDLACMFGIEGLLEVSYRTDWKLVYVDHENDVLLVGDDPWEEFVNCVKSIKILSAAEVQQLSLDGDLGNTRTQNQACTGPDDGNVWRG